MSSAGSWRSIPKIDVHAHIVLHQRDDTDLVLHEPKAQLRLMEKHNVRCACILPINYPEYFPLRPERALDWLRANNEIQADIMRTAPERLLAFADCRIDGAYALRERVHSELRRAIEELGLRGLKIHPSNLKTPADDGRLRQWLDAADAQRVPVVFHSNPSGSDPQFDESAPRTIYRAIYGRSTVFTVAHMGGAAFLETLGGDGYVGTSYGLLLIADLHGVDFCERLLRRIGIDRVLFGTDVPIFSYEDYERVFDAMGLTREEMKKIAYRNAERMLAGRPPLDS